MTEEVLRKGNLLEAVVLLEREIKDRAEITFMETVRIRHVIIGILPYVKITKLNLDASSVTSSCLGTKRMAVSPTQSRRQLVEKVLLPS